MKHRNRPAEEQAPTQITITTKRYLIEDLKLMEKNTKISVDDLVTKALMYFVATHNDYLGRNKVP